MKDRVFNIEGGEIRFFETICTIETPHSEEQFSESLLFTQINHFSIEDKTKLIIKWISKRTGLQETQTIIAGSVEEAEEIRREIHKRKMEIEGLL